LKKYNNMTFFSTNSILNFEKKPEEVVKSLAKFLGKDLSSEQVKSIVEWCSFESMKKNPTVNYEWYKDLGLFKKDGAFFRKGKIGDWLNCLSREQSMELDQVLEKNLKYGRKFEYGISDEDLTKIYEYNPTNKSEKKKI
jgi:hypothetical protein